MLLQLRKCQQLSDTDLFSDNNGSPEGSQKQLDLSTDFEFYMKVGGLVSPSCKSNNIYMLLIL